MIIDKTRKLQEKRTINSVNTTKTGNTINSGNTTNSSSTTGKITILRQIRDKLSKAEKQYQTLKVKLERYCLPCFGDRKRKLSEIQASKCELNLTLLQIENQISEIDQQINNAKVAKQIKEHMYTKLKRLLITYRNAEETFLKKIENVKLFDNLDKEPVEVKNCEMNELLQLKKSSDVEQIKQSIFFLTTMLMDIKLIISSHTSKIDRIEAYFDETQQNINQTNIELEKIPKRHNRIKNKIIYFLCLSVIVLICLSIIKAVKHKQNRL
ncbi:hypothetical protein BDAP_001886 [Binucleata daphniae]